MTNKGITLTLLCFLILIPQVASGKPWREITPLISTRLDVERILGKPNTGGDYDTPEGRAIIRYSDGKACEEGLPGLGNVPRDTVVQIDLTLAKLVPIADLLTPGQEYVQTVAIHTPQVSYYKNRVEGVEYCVQDGLVSSQTFFGSSADAAAFSCGEYKYAAPVPPNPDPLRVEQYPFDRYGKIRFEDAKARLDNFVIQLLESNREKREYRGYIIVYAGDSAYENEAKSVAACSKDYLIRTRHADSESIVAVAGGYREEFQVELYIGPINAYPPVLTPTVSPRNVQVLKGRFKPCR